MVGARRPKVRLFQLLEIVLMDTKRLIIVAKQFEPELRSATRAVARVVASLAAHDAYEMIKAHLQQKGVPHQDRHMSPHHVPTGHVYHTAH